MKTINKISRWILLATMANLFAVRCGKEMSPKQEEPAVREVITAYVRDVKQINTNQMKIDISNLTIQGDSATCQASFSLNPPVAGLQPMLYRYALAKKDGQWSVTSSVADSTGPAHSGSSLPGGMPGSGAPGGGGVPPGHPPLDGGAGRTAPPASPAKP